MKKKLQTKQKTGFAFNFAVDDDRQTGDVGGGENCDDRGSFRFGFDPMGTTIDIADAAPVRAKQRSKSGTGGSRPPVVAQQFSVYGEQIGAAAAPIVKKKKKGTNKKKKKAGKGKGKGKGKKVHSAEEEVGQDSSSPKILQEPDGATAVNDFNMPPVVAEPVTGFREYDIPLPTAAAVAHSMEQPYSFAQHPAAVSPEPAAEPGNLDQIFSSPVPPLTLRPPPGFTLESWKDPALSMEERRRRRFGRGVRNMAAIQRSRDARRGMSAERDDLVGGEEGLNRSQGRETTGAYPDRRASGDSDRLVESGGCPRGEGGSSVFSFGFDIGISFNNGS